MATDECDAAMAPQPEIGMTRSHTIGPGAPSPSRSNLHELIHKQLDDLNARLIAKDNEIRYLRDQNVQLKMEVGRGNAYARCADAKTVGVVNLYTEEKLVALSHDLVNAAEKRHG